MTMRRITLPLLIAVAAIVVAQPADTRAATVVVPVGIQPTAVASSGTTAYVTDAPSDGPGSLAFVDLRQDRVVARVTVGTNPQAVALDPAGRFAYVANFSQPEGPQPGSVSVVDLQSKKVVGTLSETGNTDNVLPVKVPGGSRLVVINEGLSGTGGTIDVWNVATMHRLARVPVTFSPTGIALLADGLHALIGDGNNGYAYRFDVSAARLGQRISIPAGPVSDIRRGPNLIYVAAAGGVSVLRPSTLAPVGNVVAPVPPYDPISIAVSTSNVGYLVNNGFPESNARGTVQVLDGARTAGAYPLGHSPDGISLAENDRLLLVTAFNHGTLWVMPTPKPLPAGSRPAHRHPRPLT